jgi:hypothetical protein
VHVHADHRRESYADGMGQVNETGAKPEASTVLKRMLTKYRHFTH